MAKRFTYDDTKFKPKQREVALALVEREFSDRKGRKTKNVIAEENGITTMTLWRWENEDANFIAYKNHLASDFMDSKLPFVYARLIDVIGEGNTKGMELFLKRIGDLDTKGELTINSNAKDETPEERIARLTERLKDADGPEEGEE